MPARRPASILAFAVLGALFLALTLACGRDEPSSIRIEDLSPNAATPLAQSRLTRTDAAASTFSAPASLHDRAAAAVRTLAQRGGGSVSLQSEGSRTAMRLMPVGPDGTEPVIRWWSPVAAATRIDLDGVTLAVLLEAARDVRLLIRAEDAPLARLFMPEGAPLRLVEGGDLAAALRAEPQALGLMPAELVTARVHALALDGVDPVRGSGDLNAYPFVTRARVETDPGNREREATARSLAEILAEPPPPPIRLLFTGDVIPSRCVYDQMRRAGDWTAPFHLVAERLRAADITVGSLDAALSNLGVPIGCRETFNLLGPAEAVEGLAFAGFDVVTNAANHAKDCGDPPGSCGSRSMLDTLARLRAAGIEPVGSGVDLAAARTPVVLTAGGVRFAFLGYDDIATYYQADAQSAGTAGLNLDTIAADVQAARAVADVVIVLPHWGVEYTPNPSERQQKAAAEAVAAGATMVMGNHPHVVQAAGPLGEGYVAYALGNFVFDQDWSVETTEGVVMEATFRGPQLVAVQFTPLRIRGRLQPQFLAPAEGRHILKRISDAAARLEGR